MFLKIIPIPFLFLLFLSNFSLAQIHQCVQQGGNYDCIPAVLKYCPNAFSPDLRQCVEAPQAYCTRNWVERTDAEWAMLGFIAYSNPRFQFDDPTKPSPGKCIYDARNLRTGETSISNGERLGYPFIDCSLYPSHTVEISDSTGLWCAKLIEYVAAAPQDSPPTSCPVGNPIDTSTGAKIQKEGDINSHGFGQIGFDRAYSNSNKMIGGFWYNPYQKSLRIIDPQKIEIVRAKSSPYTSKALACTGGFNDLKTKISDNWTQGSSAQYVNNTCQIVRNNKIIRNIPIVQSALSTEIYFKPGAIQLIREDGSILNFGLSAGDQYSELSGSRGQLIAVSDAAPVAWRYKTSNGDIEDYSVDGKLLSITASNGMKQELFYDATSGLLTRVKDSTNRELTFAYTDNQLSSITVDGNKTTSYTYNGQGLISKVIRPDNTERMYHYEDARFPTFLTGITDERGKRYATWAYDAQGRAISSEHAGGV
ncbi:DUF6531 domain-containing protein, partial [Cellvibrio mixtus]|uniref:DUF6531 domain-containing protein n=1 Tax=Cellvibrio mixtus TaxID=39650 RepID=UPI0013635009